MVGSVVQAPARSLANARPAPQGGFLFRRKVEVAHAFRENKKPASAAWAGFASPRYGRDKFAAWDSRAPTPTGRGADQSVGIQRAKLSPFSSRQ